MLQRGGMLDNAKRHAAESLESSSELEPIPPLGPGQWVDGERSSDVVDLLNLKSAITLDVEGVRKALAFSFAGGDSSEVLERASSRAPIAASDWEPTSFVEGLFIPELIRKCMRIRFEGFESRSNEVLLARLLTNPPSDRGVVDFRRGILRELSERQELRSRFQLIYRAVYQLWQCFVEEGEIFDLDGTTRRLETLGAIRKAVEHMGAGFGDSASGLRRIHDFAAQARAGEGYKRLTELLDYENHLASVDLKLRIGADGRVRRFEIVQVSENKANRFYQTPLGRVLTRIGLMFRGYFFGEGELVNRWIDSVFDGVLGLLPPLIQLKGAMEFYLAALAFKELAESKGLSVCLANLEDLDADGGREITGLFNPLLLDQERPAVPCDLSATDWATITVVTGPNSGGKTRLLQALGIAQMLSQCGMFTPAESASFGWAKGLFVSLIEQVQADQSEGRLGTEMLRIRTLFEKARPGYLILLDELCSGTNPSEGEELFRLVVSLLRELRPSAFITTHFLQFAARLEVEDRDIEAMTFLQVELDQHDQPTFRFIDGVAQTSLALQTAARLGVTRDELLALVRRNRS